MLRVTELFLQLFRVMGFFLELLRIIELVAYGNGGVFFELLRIMNEIIMTIKVSPQSASRAVLTLEASDTCLKVPLWSANTTGEMDTTMLALP